MKTKKIQFINITFNGKEHILYVGEQPGEILHSDTLAHTLRETLGLTGTKIGCDEGACGACTVLVDGEPQNSCMLLTVEQDGKKITTIEGLADPLTGALDPVQKSFAEHTAFQCGFCTPGIIMAARALLDKNSDPTEDEIKTALSGHFCRCISHYHVLEAVKAAARAGKDTKNG
jgi:aerobic carbon-monoxide dehydrogenase small subunit